MAGKRRAVSTAEKACSVEGCEKPILAKRLCSPHYQRQWRHGDPLLGGSAHCVWTSEDEEGRPACVHGPAVSHGAGKWQCSKKTKATQRKWREKNPEAAREGRRKWREENPEAVREYQRKWHEQRARKASAIRRRLAKLHNLMNNPSATPAERDTARLHAARLTERMIHGS